MKKVMFNFLTTAKKAWVCRRLALADYQIESGELMIAFMVFLNVGIVEQIDKCHDLTCSFFRIVAVRFRASACSISFHTNNKSILLFHASPLLCFFDGISKFG